MRRLLQQLQPRTLQTLRQMPRLRRLAQMPRLAVVLMLQLMQEPPLKAVLSLQQRRPWCKA